MSVLENVELITEQSGIQMMYEYSELMEELVRARTYLTSYLEDLEPDQFYSVPDGCPYSIAHCLGHLAYIEKELGKKAEVDFSFRLDSYDEIFADIEFPMKISDLPKKDELMIYFNEVHDVFVDEIRYRKKNELIFILINQYYQHALKLAKILGSMGQKSHPIYPDSPRIKRRSDDGDIPLFHLPVYTN